VVGGLVKNVNVILVGIFLPLENRAPMVRARVGWGGDG
jgi:hypothetical protein